MSAAGRLARGVGWVLIGALLIVLLIQLWYFGWIVLWRWHDPGETSFMHRERIRLAQLHRKPALRHQWVGYDRISNHLKRAVIAAEDARFLEHEGVDWEAVQKAYETNLKRGRTARGGSTITQQLAKNLFLSPERSYLRKGQELVLTYMIELVWDKRRILEVYLNVAEWGEGVFGAEAAARHYYGVSAAQLDADQAARLAAMLPRPRFYDRNRGSAYLARRADAILRFMNDSQIP
ncbi:MAG: monofunctional biosynthetic peptidoglycan transglycosylase [Gemmatimonadota bacterium]